MFIYLNNIIITLIAKEKQIPYIEVTVESITIARLKLKSEIYIFRMPAMKFENCWGL
jgi:hypothetical protein